MTERNALVLLLLVSCQPSLNAYIFSFLFFLQFEFVLLCFCFALFCFFFSLIFQANTNSILFHLVVENLISYIFLIIMIIMQCSGMFRNVPGCSGMFIVPGFINALIQTRFLTNQCTCFLRTVSTISFLQVVRIQDILICRSVLTCGLR